MPELVEVRTQAGLDKALEGDDVIPVCVGSGCFVVSDSASVRAYDSASVRAYGSASVRASQFVAVHDRGTRTKINGGMVITVPKSSTAAEWLDYRGVPVIDGGCLTEHLAGVQVVVLFKAVDDEFTSSRLFRYVPGTTPHAPDWDDGDRECGGGLHFCPTPHHAARFNSDATRFVACPVRVDEIVVHENAMYPQKVKAPGCCAPVWEVDRDGNRLAEQVA